MQTQTVGEMILALIAFGLVGVGTTSASLSPLTWVGAWVLIIAVLWHLHRRESKPRSRAKR